MTEKEQRMLAALTEAALYIEVLHQQLPKSAAASGSHTMMIVRNAITELYASQQEPPPPPKADRKSRRQRKKGPPSRKAKRSQVAEGR